MRSPALSAAAGRVSRLRANQSAGARCHALRWLRKCPSCSDVPAGFVAVTRAILDDGRLVGVWEFDPSVDRIVTASFAALHPDSAAALAAECARLEAFFARLGDARAYRLDSIDSLVQRARWVRDLARRQRTAA